ncbi:MAG: HEPN domain-containing protein [Candidatus Thermoplasmatota archaeon]|nr:HEPN domain-containing protein [Candidatus Thermoplasmatota archaeon]
MTLDELEREGYTKRLPADKKKVEDAFNLAKRDIKVAKAILRENDDWAFSIAYNAILQAIRALMFSKGYRPSGRNQHISAVRFAELFLRREEVIVLDRMRRKRHATVYDTAGTISEKEADNAVERAGNLVQEIERILGGDR